MINACALYFPTEELPFKSVFPRGRSDGGIFRSPTWFEYDTADGPIRLNLQHDDLARHLRGFKGYIAQLPNTGAARSKAQALITCTKSSVGVILPHPVAPDSAAIGSLVDLIKRFDGFMFVNDSIMLPDGSFLVGPMAPNGPTFQEPPLVHFNPNDCKHLGPTEGVLPERVAMREAHYRQLAQRGFQSSRWLPIYRTSAHTDTMRPITEIVSRLLALKALFLWVAAPEHIAPAESLVGYVQQNALRAHLTSDEQEILALSRPQANRSHANDIGWRLENMWALSWILGFDEPPPFFQGQLPQSVIDRMLFEFLPGFEVSVPQFLVQVQPHDAQEVGQLEDLYYCAHNAVRSAQLGESTVPPQFHPVRDGGAIHERRHALTWALSAGTDWADTDLST